MEDQLIGDVSDTSLWVAHYRAAETARPDALFKDPYAAKLAGEKGERIALDMKAMGKYVEWSVVSRTLMIDEFILQLIAEGVDTVVNLGAGLDSRPYRMTLPASLHWIEVDYPSIIRHKTDVLKNEQPSCRLTRVALDLSDDEKRREFLAKTDAEAKKILVITEGVVPYLTPAQVGTLADDLRARPHFQYWIVEYFDARVYKYLKSSIRTKKMKNAPFQFYPSDWLGFFESHGWVKKSILYSLDIVKRTGRMPPMPWWATFLIRLAPKEKRELSQKMNGFVVLKKK